MAEGRDQRDLHSPGSHHRVQKRAFPARLRAHDRDDAVSAIGRPREPGSLGRAGRGALVKVGVCVDDLEGVGRGHVVVRLSSCSVRVVESEERKSASSIALSFLCLFFSRKYEKTAIFLLLSFCLLLRTPFLFPLLLCLLLLFNKNARPLRDLRGVCALQAPEGREA